MQVVWCCLRPGIAAADHASQAQALGTQPIGTRSLSNEKPITCTSSTLNLAKGSPRVTDCTSNAANRPIGRPHTSPSIPGAQTTSPISPTVPTKPYVTAETSSYSSSAYCNSAAFAGQAPTLKPRLFRDGHAPALAPGSSAYNVAASSLNSPVPDATSATELLTDSPALSRESSASLDKSESYAAALARGPDGPSSATPHPPSESAAPKEAVNSFSERLGSPATVLPRPVGADTEAAAEAGVTRRSRAAAGTRPRVLPAVPALPQRTQSTPFPEPALERPPAAVTARGAPAAAAATRSALRAVGGPGSLRAPTRQLSLPLPPSLAAALSQVDACAGAVAVAVGGPAQLVPAARGAPGGPAEPGAAGACETAALGAPEQAASPGTTAAQAGAAGGEVPAQPPSAAPLLAPASSPFAQQQQAVMVAAASPVLAEEALHQSAPVPTQHAGVHAAPVPAASAAAGDNAWHAPLAGAVAAAVPYDAQDQPRPQPQTMVPFASSAAGGGYGAPAAVQGPCGLPAAARPHEWAHGAAANAGATASWVQQHAVTVAADPRVAFSPQPPPPPRPFPCLDLAGLSREVAGLRWVGQGGGGAVFQGVWQGAAVAVKFVLADCAGPGAADAAALEAVLSSSVGHPNVVNTYCYGVTRLTYECLQPEQEPEEEQEARWQEAGPGAGGSGRHGRRAREALLDLVLRGGAAAADAGPSPSTAAAPSAPPSPLGSRRRTAEDALFESGEGFGDPDCSAWRNTWRVQQVLWHMRARPGQYLTHMIMEYCDRGSLLSAIRAGIFRLADPDTDADAPSPTPPSAASSTVVSPLPPAPPPHPTASHPAASAAAAPRFSRRVVLRALLRTAREVAQGMSHLHAAGIIHGDLKPGNVLLRGCRLDRRGFTALVCDFGLAQVSHGEAALEAHQWATVTAMAPEAILGRWLRASDVWSYGILLWQLATGRLQPYPPMPVSQLLLGVAQGALAPVWPASVPPPLAALGRACLAAHPEERPTFPEVVQALIRIETDVRNELRDARPAAQ